MKNQRNNMLQTKAGCRISLYSGEIEWNHLERMSTLKIYQGLSGDKLQLLDYDYEYAVATYAPVFDEKYIYTYDYQKEQNWTTYQNDLNEHSYGQDEYLFSKDLFFRVNLKRKDGKDISDREAERISEILKWIQVEKSEMPIKPFFIDEIEKTAESVKKFQNEDTLSFILLTDSHVTVNGTWEDTKNNLQKLSEKIECHGIVHLGDCTDGMVPKEVTIDVIEKMQQDLGECKKPVYYVIGNHDTNYFQNNPDRFQNNEVVDLYLRTPPLNVCRENKKMYYFADFEAQEIRCIFLDSFDYNEPVRYGFSDEELEWLENVLNKTPKDFGIIIFSHVTPIPRLHYWTNEIRGSDRLINIIKEFQNKEEQKILAFIHGHNHADQIDLQEGFPIISIGCAKCEYFEDKKPEGSFTPERKLDTLTQELWDILLISRKEMCLDLIRFGAGENRHIKLD